MNIGKRLHELRQAKGLSQGDIQKRTGLLRCYVSRVENGHTVPSLETLEKMARALDLELYQLFFAGKGKPAMAVVRTDRPRNREEGNLLGLFRQLNAGRRRLLLGLARQMASQSNRK
jgi:transcriptional regulator with XRE-family HTH domain